MKNDLSDQELLSKHIKSELFILRLTWFTAFIPTALCAIGFSVKAFKELTPIDFSHIFNSANYFLNFVIIYTALALIAVYFIPKILRALAKKMTSNQIHLISSILRLSLLFTIASMGCIYSVMNRNFTFAIPFSFISFSVLIIFYPLKKDVFISENDKNKVLEDLKLDIPSNPLGIKIFGGLLIALGLLDQGFGGYNAAQYSKGLATRDFYGLGSNVFGYSAILFGIMLLNQHRICKKRPKLFWAIIILCLFQLMVGIAKNLNSKKTNHTSCVTDCEILEKNGELSTGITKEMCIAKLCNN